MTTEWFYTTNKQQMGPVSWNELRELAEGGILKPHDLVWTDGMEEWVKAVNQLGLFADGIAGVKVKQSSYAETKPPPGRRSKRTEDDDKQDEDEDERKAKRKNRQREQERTKMAVGLKIGLALAGAMFVLVLLVGCAGVLIYWSLAGGAGGGKVAGPRTTNYTVNNLMMKRLEEKRFDFRQGQRVIITAQSTTTMPKTDVDLWVYRGNAPDNMPLISDVTIGPNSRVEFVVPANDSYRVRIGNHGPGMATVTRVTVEER